MTSEVLQDPIEMERLAKGVLGFGHPVRVQCLVLLATEHSPSELFEAQQVREIDAYGNELVVGGPTLGTVSYHVRMLRSYGLVVETRTRPARGALEHFYVRTELADEIFDALAPVYGLRRGRAKRKAPALAA